MQTLSLLTKERVFSFFILCPFINGVWVSFQFLNKPTSAAGATQQLVKRALFFWHTAKNDNFRPVGKRIVVFGISLALALHFQGFCPTWMAIVPNINKSKVTLR